MSPAAEILENIRLRRKLPQSVFARLAGLHASYFSGILRGKYHIPTHSKFLQKISSGLGLSESQIEKLRQAIEMSPKALTVPPRADREVFLMVAELNGLLSDMDGNTASQIRKQIAHARDQAHA